ncbi:tol-pal system-associated acyl-CoA thioesterase [Acidihalobacter yilgarnensis]|uniref:Tol-pal system-associated acyl-CoA thioesterase n=1 Tax=Acidihalobacter yilgarnensis TaxID=2819280 RepID=A0A1D8IR61_9GAMM|nr:tol-pal system-associated acyl-CoA thioesterase [Acidihalobacter yilgarnensis]AOU98956.1 tol-pal system-associated acyl-CoA thioesterase [Acidihalobacter yilgarnensis]
MEVFSWPVRVYYEDTDTAGVVYYANYLKFMERARTEWLRSLGFEQDSLMRDPGVVFAVRAVSVDYRYPARFNDALEVTASVSRIRPASVVIAHEIRRNAQSGNAQLLTCGSVKLACLDAASFSPVAFPENILEAVVRVS